MFINQDCTQILGRAVFETVPPNTINTATVPKIALLSYAFIYDPITKLFTGITNDDNDTTVKITSYDGNIIRNIIYESPNKIDNITSLGQGNSVVGISVFKKMINQPKNPLSHRELYNELKKLVD